MFLEKAILFQQYFTFVKINNSITMKKLLLNLSLLFLVGQSVCAQDTLLFENFESGAPDNYSLNPPTGTENFWINFDGDGLPDGSSGGRPLEWFAGIGYDLNDTNNTVAVSNSWTNDPNTPIQNWIMSPPITVSDASYTLFWKSAPYQTPYYLDGYKVLVSTSNNLESSFTDTLAVFAEYESRLNPLPDSTYNSYTFSEGFVHGADGQYVVYPGDSARLRGLLRPDSVNLAAYAGQTIYLGFVADSHDDNLLFIDDIMVYSPTANAIRENSNQDFNMQLYPNPASAISRVNFTVDRFSPVIISIMDAQGKIVKRFDRGQLMSGNHFADLDLSNIPQGNYFVQISSNNKTEASKLTIVK
jgi:hypothetical protein